MIKNDFDHRLLQALLICSGLATFFYGATTIATRSWGAWYLLPNLFLASIPLFLTYPLLDAARNHGWLDSRTGAWALAWLGFLPNSFYVVTDSIHLLDHSYGLDPLSGMVIFGLFGFTGMSMGMACLYFVHRELLKAFSRVTSLAVIEAVILLSSVAIYLGRTLRWNTWDIALHPVGVLEDGVRLIVAPTPESMGMVGLFLILLTGLYVAIYLIWDGKSIFKS